MATAKKTITKGVGKAPKKEAKPKVKTVKKIKSKVKPVKVNVYNSPALKKTEAIVSGKAALNDKLAVRADIKAEDKNKISALRDLNETPIFHSVPPVIKNAFQAEPEKKAQEKPAVTPRSLGLYRKIAFSFLFCTLALLAIIFYFSFVKVFISIVPNKEKISNNLIVDIYDQEKNTNIAENGIVGAVKRIEVSDTKNYPASGAESTGGEVAGKVIIFNKYNKNQPLVASTRLLTPDNKLFRLKNTINVPAGGSVEAEVYADNPTPGMNIAPTRFTIPGLWAGLQDKIYAESKDAIKYAGQEKIYIVQADIDAGIADLKQGLLEKVKTEVNDSYKDYNKVLYSIDDNSVSTEVGGKIKEEKEEFAIFMKAAVIVVAFKDDKITDLAKEKLMTVISDDKEFSDFNKNDIIYTLNNYNIDQGTATVSANFEGTVSLKEDALKDDSIIDRHKMVGLNKDQLNDYLATFPEIASYEIRFSPSFLNKVPSLIDRIIIELRK